QPDRRRRLHRVERRLPQRQLAPVVTPHTTARERFRGRPTGPPSDASFDGHDRPSFVVELVQVFGDAVAGLPFIRPAGQTFIDDRAAVAVTLGQAGDAENVGAQLVHPVAFVGGPHVRDAMRQAVVGQLGAYVPFP